MNGLCNCSIITKLESFKTHIGRHVVSTCSIPGQGKMVRIQTVYSQGFLHHGLWKQTLQLLLWAGGGRDNLVFILPPETQVGTEGSRTFIWSPERVSFFFFFREGVLNWQGLTIQWGQPLSILHWPAAGSWVPWHPAHPSLTPAWGVLGAPHWQAPRSRKLHTQREIKISSLVSTRKGTVSRWSHQREGQVNTEAEDLFHVS